MGLPFGRAIRCIFCFFNYELKAFEKKTRKSSDRKSPTGSATKQTIGTEMIGKDGNMWVIKADKNGVNHWKKI